MCCRVLLTLQLNSVFLFQNTLVVGHSATARATGDRWWVWGPHVLGCCHCLAWHCLAAVRDPTLTDSVYNYVSGVIDVFVGCAWTWLCLHQKWARLVGPE
jgi:hypothetical protein